MDSIKHHLIKLQELYLGVCHKKYFSLGLLQDAYKGITNFILMDHRKFDRSLKKRGSSSKSKNIGNCWKRLNLKYK